MPQNDDQLQEQYQEILNKYASSLAPSDTSTITPEPPPELPLEPTPVLETVSPPSEPIIAPEPPIVSGPIPQPIYFPPKPESNRGGGFFKFLFYISLLIFIGVASAIIYNIFNKPVTPVNLKTAGPTTAPTSQFCELNDKKYAIDESFPSADLCNTCTCTSNLTIVCTQKACVSPTAKPTTKPISGKTYKDIKYGYQFICPTTAKYVVEATSVNGNKIPYKQESCTTADYSVIISIYDNTVIHNFGNLQTQISPDKKYIFTFEGDNSDIISSFKFL